MIFDLTTKPISVPGFKTKSRYVIRVSTSGVVDFYVKRATKKVFIKDIDLILSLAPWLEKYVQLSGVSSKTGVTPYWWIENSMYHLLNNDMDLFCRMMPTITNEEILEIKALADYGIHKEGRVGHFHASGKSSIGVYENAIRSMNIPERSKQLIKELEQQCAMHYAQT